MLLPPYTWVAAFGSGLPRLQFHTSRSDSSVMPFKCARWVRLIILPILALASLLAAATPASAQGFGLGGRFAWVTGDSDADVDSVRYFGGQMRLISKRVGLEV